MLTLFNSERPNTFLQSGAEQISPFSPILFMITLKVITSSIRQEEKVKLSLFSGNMIIYIENPKSYKKAIKTSNFYNVVEYKINLKKSVIFLYSNNEL